MEEKKGVFRCDYFKVEELAEGVYVALASEEGGAVSNSGIIDLGDKTIVFDSFLSVDAAHELRKFTEEATGRKVSYVANSHIHFDMGDLLFTGTHPWMGAGDPAHWVNTIHDFKKYGADILMPGHGSAGSMHELLLIEEYIKEIDSVAVKVNEGRLKLEDINEKILPEPFDR